MKIAVAANQDSVAAHFGHCANFAIFLVEGGKITGRESLPNPGHRPGFLPKFLHDQGVDVIISGGMGLSAIRLFEEQGITVVTGASGQPEKVVCDYLSETLPLSSDPCRDH